MNIEWWMIDGAICLIVLAAAIRGIARGIGDTVVRIAAILGGLVLGTMFSGKVAEWLATTKVNGSLHDHFFEIIRGDEQAGTGAVLGGPVTGDEGTFADNISRSLGSIFSDAADKAAEAAAERLTEIALGILSFGLILLVVALLAFVIRSLIKGARKRLVVLGFTDRVLGMALGVVRGLLIAWIAVALLIPLTTLLSPDNTPAMMEALKETYIAKVMYDVNPLLLVRYAFKA